MKKEEYKEDVGRTIAEIRVYLAQIEINFATMRTCIEVVQKAQDKIGEMLYNLNLKEVEREENKERNIYVPSKVTGDRSRVETINRDALQICPYCGEKNLVLYTMINQPSKLFCLNCGTYWMEIRNE